MLYLLQVSVRFTGCVHHVSPLLDPETKLTSTIAICCHGDREIAALSLPQLIQ